MATSQQVQALYIAYFGRPADPDGLAHWTQVGDLESLADQMANSPEYKAATFGKDPRDVINSFYVNLFGRNGEFEGVYYWLAAVADGDTTLQQAGLYIGRAALENPIANFDTEALVAKTIAADKFTADVARTNADYSGESGIEAGRLLLATITGVSSIPSDDQIAGSVGGLGGGSGSGGVSGGALSSTYTLTIETDLATTTGTQLQDLSFGSGANVGFPAFAFTTGNEVVNGVGAAAGVAGRTVNGTDRLTDGSTADQDVLNITGTTGDLENLVSVNIETINYTGLAVTAGAIILDNSNATRGVTATGLRSVTAAGSVAGTLRVDAAGTGATNINLSGVTAGGGLTTVIGGSSAGNAATFVGSALADSYTGSAANDTMTGGAGADNFVTTGGANSILDFSAGGVEDTVTISAGSTLTATVTGDFEAAGQEIDNDATNTSATFILANDVDFNASFSTATTGGITITAANNAAASVIRGTDQSDIVLGGNGADTITGDAGDDHLNGAGGADTFVFTGSNGSDTILEFVTTTDKLNVDGIVANVAGNAFVTYDNTDKSSIATGSIINNAAATAVADAAAVVALFAADDDDDNANVNGKMELDDNGTFIFISQDNDGDAGTDFDATVYLVATGLATTDITATLIATLDNAANSSVLAFDDFV